MPCWKGHDVGTESGSDRVASSILVVRRAETRSLPLPVLTALPNEFALSLSPPLPSPE